MPDLFKAVVDLVVYALFSGSVIYSWLNWCAYMSWCREEWVQFTMLWKVANSQHWKSLLKTVIVSLASRQKWACVYHLHTTATERLSLTLWANVLVLTSRMQHCYYALCIVPSLNLALWGIVGPECCTCAFYLTDFNEHCCLIKWRQALLCAPIPSMFLHVYI